MSENLSAPYLLQLKDAVSAIHLSEIEASKVIGSVTEAANIAYVPSYDQSVEQQCVPHTQIIEKGVDCMEIETHNTLNGSVHYIYEVVYPEQLNLKPVYSLKRGRPKKKKVEEVPVEPPRIVKPAPRTRSGRVIKFPKHIEKDFKKVEIEDSSLEKEKAEFRTTEFVQFVEEAEDTTKTKQIQLEFHQRRRKISAQYRCPKCNKAYLGKMKMIQHIKKYPDHGPLPCNDLNFDVWNYLVDITQKCPPAQRGIKFCEELTNLLHNVLLLTSALFKKAELNKNHVEVDKVLGNAIGLPPGPYKFNDSELYKDVTVLKLITNSDFFKPVSRNDDSFYVMDKTMEDQKINRYKSENSETTKIVGNNDKKDIKDKYGEKDMQNKSDLERYFGKEQSNQKNELPSQFSIDKIEQETKTVSPLNKTNIGVYFDKEQSNWENVLPTQFSIDKIDHETKTMSPSTLNTHQDELYKSSDMTEALSDNHDKKKHISNLGDRIVHSDLLSENSLLNLPNLRNSVDELILTGVDSGSTILDNSTSSDEVMNVDQFVNERFKKITEPDIELSGGTLNLDLPSLDLFQFHTS